ncbi:MAG: hypothetical protein QNL04_00105 [SAR324 cluster bacterium]|nr:hypothetical protein [SAR324 cluster bacterium]
MSKKPFYPEITPIKAETEKEHLEKLFLSSKKLIQSLPLQNHPQLSFIELRGMIKAKAAANQVFKKRLASSLEWVDYVEKNSNRFKNLYQFPYLWQAAIEPQGLVYTEVNKNLVTPFQEDMFAQCKAAFYYKNKKHLQINSGYRSPAYQLFLTSFLRGNLSEVFEKAAPPFYSRHQKEEPDLSIGLVYKEKDQELEAELLAQVGEICSAYGITQSFPGVDNLKFEFSTEGQENYYKEIWDSPALPAELKEEIKAALSYSSFYPSKQGLKVIFAMAWKESSWRWDPRLIKPKKKALRQTFSESLKKLDSGMTGTVANYFLDKKFFKRKDKLKKELWRITEPNNFHLTEWDVYVWTKEAHKLLTDLEAEYSTLAKFGSIIFDYKPLLNRFANEPQSFGLWQVNINYLIEKIEGEKYWINKYPEIFRWGKVRRTELIKALSSKEDAKLDHTQTLSLIFEAYLAPRYFNHNLGTEWDNLFFAAENLTGALSSYRASVQVVLREKLDRQIIADGDLANYHPYSKKVDLNRSSQTLTLLKTYMRRKNITPKKQKSMIFELVSAQGKEQLLTSKLYRLIMKGQIGRRDMPEVKSRIIGQSPYSYGNKVLTLAGSY